MITETITFKFETEAQQRAFHEELTRARSKPATNRTEQLIEDAKTAISIHDGVLALKGLVAKLDSENARLRTACEASWALGHKVYHQAATPDSPDWVMTRKLLAEALGKTL